MRQLFLPLCFLFVLGSVAQLPNPKHLEEVTYDTHRNKLLLFGGSEIIPGGWSEPSAIYEWDEKGWKRYDGMGPTGRRGHGWVYDENLREALLIGGVTKGNTTEDSLVFDVWSWNGARWKLLDSTCPVKEPETAYDQINKRVFVYGEAKGSTAENVVFELWEYQAPRWKRLSAEGPSIIGSRMIVFDSKRNRLVIPIFTEKELVVWDWTGESWEKELCKSPCPSYRTRFAFVYSPIEQAALLFGGLSEKRDQLADLWKWKGKNWEQIVTTPVPSPRNSAHFAFLKTYPILYGGSIRKRPPQTGIEATNEMWGWVNGKWELLK